MLTSSEWSISSKRSAANISSSLKVKGVTTSINRFARSTSCSRGPVTINLNLSLLATGMGDRVSLGGVSDVSEPACLILVYHTPSRGHAIVRVEGRPRSHSPTMLGKLRFTR